MRSISEENDKRMSSTASESELVCTQQTTSSLGVEPNQEARWIRSSSRTANYRNRPVLVHPVLLDDILSIIDAYAKRTFAEDIDILSALYGIDNVLANLDTDSYEGIQKVTSEDLRCRREKYGANILPTMKPHSFLKLLLDASEDIMMRVLMVAGLISLILGVSFGKRRNIEWIEGATIFLAVVIVLLVTAINDWMRQHQFRQLSEQEERYCRVMRQGEKKEIECKELLVGDMLVLEVGDDISVDGIVVHCTDFRVDESSVTGESEATRKDTFVNCKKKVEEVKSSHEADTLKHDMVPSVVVLSGTTVSGGQATVCVVGVGTKSVIGKTFQKLATDTDPTPLQMKLNALARDIGFAGLFAAIATLVFLVVEFWIIYWVVPRSSRPKAIDIVSEHINYVIEAITVVVVAVPEGLPLAVTISLAFSVKKMLRDQNYVRRMAACETMGGANEICCDKTGTLTKNRMSVAAFWNDSILDTDLDLTNKPEQVPVFPPPYMGPFLENIAINSTGFIETSEVDVKDGSNRKITVKKHVGSASECALIDFMISLGYNRKVVRNSTLRKHTNKSDEGLILQIPFSSERKCMTTVIICPDDPNLYRVLIKGAGERVLKICTRRVDSTGTLQMLGPNHLQRIERSVVHLLSSMALRTFCLAYKDFDPAEIPNWAETQPGNPLFRVVEQDFIVTGIAGIRDPVRDEVPVAVKRCQDAGITVRMVTGDNVETAKQIGLTCNIYRPEAGGLAMLGSEFYRIVGGVVCEKCRTEVCDCLISSTQRQMVATEDEDRTETPANDEGGGSCWRTAQREPAEKKDLEQQVSGKPQIRKDVLGNLAEFEAIKDRLHILARSQPSDKYALVIGLKQLGAVVAVTGDGTNDAPALRTADVGVAMGITGKDVAKQAADIVLLDDNFESIVKAVMWGRNIYDNIRRFLQFQLTVNIVAVSIAFISAAVLRDSPLNVVQLLWVNLIMDSFAALALATEPPTLALLDQKPHSRMEYLISQSMWRNIIGSASYQLVVSFLIIFCGECWIPETGFPVTPSQHAEFPDFSPYSECTSWVAYKTLRSGRKYVPFSTQQDYKEEWATFITPSRHYTFLFNTFVWMQVFNLVNSRKINPGEINVFGGLGMNYMWLLIVAIICVGQVIMVELGGFALQVNLYGLTYQQWLLSVAFGVGGLLWSILVRLLPSRTVDKVLPQTGNREVNPLTEPASIAMMSRGRFSAERISSRMIMSPHFNSKNLQTRRRSST